MTAKIRLNPSTPRSVNEGSALTYIAVFYDTGGTAAAPTSIRYRIDDVQSGEQILEWTSIATGTAWATGAATATVAISASLNVLEDEDNRRERRRLTVEAGSGTETAVNGGVEFDVIGAYGL